MFAGFAAATLLVAVVALLAIQNLTRSIRSADWVNHTHGLINEAESMVGAMRAGDAALMRFLLTADARDQVAAREAHSEMLEHLEVTLALLKSDSAWERPSRELEQAARRHVDLATELSTLGPSESPADLKQRLLSPEFIELPRQVREGVNQLKSRHIGLLQERDETAYRQALTTRWTVFTAVGNMILLLAAVFWLVRDDLAARRRAAATLREMNEELEARVKERTRQLAEANEALTLENLERTWSNQTLEHQLRYSQLIINTITDPIVVVTQTLNVVRVNAAVPARTGLMEKRLIGNSAAQFLRGPEEPGPAPGQEAASLAPISAAMRNQRELHGLAARLRTADGRWQPVRVSAFPVHDADKAVAAVLTIRAEDSLA